MNRPIQQSLNRRRFLNRLCQMSVAGTILSSSLLSYALQPDSLPLKSIGRHDATLSTQQALVFRQWLQVIIRQQLNRGPTPRWQQRDCAGLFRFACAEALRSHPLSWVKANGLLARKLPPDLQLTVAQQQWRHNWLRADGSQGAYVSALELIQNNTRFLSRHLTGAQVGDLLLFDQGQNQHLMIWMGPYIAYHTGTVTPDDNGLRAYTLPQLLKWTDTRWQPADWNPNFIGLFRPNFLGT